MNEDFYLIRLRRCKDENGRDGVQLHVGWGVILLSAAIFSVLVYR